VLVSDLCRVLSELARFASGVMCLLLATVTLDLSNYLSYIPVC
jgi:hypothetical protein